MAKVEVVVNEGGTVQQGRRPHGPGEVVKVERDEAERLVGLGAVSTSVEKRAPQKVADDSDLPEDLPGRTALVSAGLSLEQVRSKIDDGSIVEVAGIGEAKAADLKAWSEG